jgi:coenzyme F420-reducing hydrogenase beta subunit
MALTGPSERLYAIGTPCPDNTMTERFHELPALLDPAPETISYLEFRADYHAASRFDDGRLRREVPFLKLPIAKLPRHFFPLTCHTCVGYTNVLADITVGYMGGEGEQWLLVRNDRARRCSSFSATRSGPVSPAAAASARPRSPASRPMSSAPAAAWSSRGRRWR